MYDIVSSPWPLCGKCGKEVEKLASFKDPFRNVTVFVAFCHGDNEEMAIDDYMLVLANCIEPGIAFNTLKLTE